MHESRPAASIGHKYVRDCQSMLRGVAACASHDYHDYHQERKGFMPAMQGANLARGSTCPLCIRGPVYLGADSCFPEPACVVAYNTSHETSHGRILTLVSADVRLHSMCVPDSTLHSWRAKNEVPSTQEFLIPGLGAEYADPCSTGSRPCVAGATPCPRMCARIEMTQT
jgi:hypothetical protein